MSSCSFTETTYEIKQSRIKSGQLHKFIFRQLSIFVFVQSFVQIFNVCFCFLIGCTWLKFVQSFQDYQHLVLCHHAVSWTIDDEKIRWGNPTKILFSIYGSILLVTWSPEIRLLEVVLDEAVTKIICWIKVPLISAA